MQGRTTVRATLDNGAASRPATNTSVARGSQSNKSSEDDGEEKSLWEKFVSFFENIFSPEETPEPASSTPQVFTMVTVPPTASPKPTPTLTPSPTPGMTEREVLASKAVDFANDVLGKPYSNSGRLGTKGYDCSGLVIAVCRESGSQLPFDDIHLRKTCKYGMAQSYKDNKQYGTVTYEFGEDEFIDELQEGDLVFYANPDNLEQNVHVAIATGNEIFDPETGKYWPQVIEASGYSKDVTNQFTAFNVLDEGQYIRRHTDQVVTFVIRPNYDWKEQ